MRKRLALSVALYNTYYFLYIASSLDRMEYRQLGHTIRGCDVFRIILKPTLTLHQKNHLKTIHFQFLINQSSHTNPHGNGWNILNASSLLPLYDFFSLLPSDIMKSMCTLPSPSSPTPQITHPSPHNDFIEK